MQKKFDPLELKRPISLSPNAGRVSFANSRSAPVAPAVHRELPATLLKLEPKPLSAYDDNPVLDPVSAACFVGVTEDTLKKWRYRQQGPDYIQYGPNGAVRYELKDLMAFRDRYKVGIKR
jgi:hypothetical protein